MIKVVPYILTSGSKRFGEFISQPFTTDILCSENPYFDGWTKIINSYKNDEGYILEFHSNHYVIKKDGGNINYRLSLPRDVDDFINDMHRLNIQLFWTQWIDDNFEPKEYLNVNEIEEYYRNLLGRMGKSHELL